LSAQHNVMGWVTNMTWCFCVEPAVMAWLE